MSDQLNLDLHKAKDFFLNKEWILFECNECGRLIFIKPSGNHLQSCTHDEATIAPVSFKELSRNNKVFLPTDIANNFIKFFVSRGYTKHESRLLANQTGNTDLVIAGVQIFDDVFHSGAEVYEAKYIVLQPSVRMQFMEQIAQGGVSTSFVNICTEMLSVSLEEHLISLDSWLSFLSSLGMHTKDFVLVLKTVNKDWGFSKFQSLETTILYGGLELGDANFAKLTMDDGRDLSISDVGFGLERVSWAFNKTENYHDLLIPLALSEQFRKQDSIRSATLLAMCGINPGPKGSRFQLRKLCKAIAQTDQFRLIDAIGFYYEYWATFLSPLLSVQEVVGTIQLELDRLVNEKISEIYNLPPPNSESTESYAKRLICVHKVDVGKIREFIQECRAQMLLD